MPSTKPRKTTLGGYTAQLLGTLTKRPTTKAAVSMRENVVWPKILGTEHYFWLSCRTLQIELAPRAVYLDFKYLWHVLLSPQECPLRSYTLN